MHTDSDSEIVLNGLEPDQTITIRRATVTAGVYGPATFTEHAGTFRIGIVYA